MKILAIGDFHGKFPEKLKNIAKGKDIDLILSTGDFANADKIRKIIFKNWTDRKWYEVVGKKKAARLEKEGYDSGLKILKQLNSFGKRAYIIFGNTDFYEDIRASEPSSIMPEIYEPKIKKMKNLFLAERKKIKIRGFEIFGHGKYLDATEFIKNPIDKDKKKKKHRLNRYEADVKKLNSLLKNKMPKKGFIFLAHYPAYDYFDKVRNKSSPMNGRHVGFNPYNSVIKKYNPSLFICGHMHEHQGKKRLGNTLIVSTGAAGEGKAALIDFDEKKKRVKSVRFIR